MKKLLFLLLSISAISQTPQRAERFFVGTGYANDMPSYAALEIRSANKGLLLPKWTNATMNATTPGSGGASLLIWNIDEEAYFYWDGDSWERLTPEIDGFIPLSGTSPGNPVTGDIEMSELARGLWTTGANSGDYQGVNFAEGGVSLYGQSSGNEQTSITVSPAGISVNSKDSANNPGAGIVGNDDFSPNYTDLSFVQKKYVDDAIAAGGSAQGLEANRLVDNAMSGDVNNTGKYIHNSSGNTISIGNNSGIGTSVLLENTSGNKNMLFPQSSYMEDSSGSSTGYYPGGMNVYESSTKSGLDFDFGVLLLSKRYSEQKYIHLGMDNYPDDGESFSTYFSWPKPDENNATFTLPLSFSVNGGEKQFADSSGNFDITVSGGGGGGITDVTAGSGILVDTPSEGVREVSLNRDFTWSEGFLRLGADTGDGYRRFGFLSYGQPETGFEDSQSEIFSNPEDGSSIQARNTTTGAYSTVTSQVTSSRIISSDGGSNTNTFTVSPTLTSSNKPIDAPELRIAGIPVVPFSVEAAQDAVGGAFDSTLSYNDGANTMGRAAISGDVVVPAGSNTATLATVNSNTGSFGNATTVPQFTVNGKGLITAVTGVPILITASQVSDFTTSARGAAVVNTLAGNETDRAGSAAAVNTALAGKLTNGGDTTGNTLIMGSLDPQTVNIIRGNVTFFQLNAASIAVRQGIPFVSSQGMNASSLDLGQNATTTRISKNVNNAVTVATIANDNQSSTGNIVDFASNTTGATTVKASVLKTGQFQIQPGTASDHAVTFGQLQTAGLDTNLPITASRTLTIADWGNSANLTVFVNATSAAVIVTLPDAATTAGRTVNIIKTDASANAAQVKGNGSQLVNGSNTYNLTGQYQTAQVKSNGTQNYLF